MNPTESPPQNLHNAFRDAALEYCAVADWFEAHPCPWNKRLTTEQALAIFNRAEAKLRATGGKVLRSSGRRDLILQSLGIPDKTR